MIENGIEERVVEEKKLFFFKQKTEYDVLNVTGVQTCALPISNQVLT